MLPATSSLNTCIAIWKTCFGGFFFARFGFVHRFKRVDSFSMWIGRDETGAVLPVTRVIDFKKNPSLHKCDARCRTAKGHNCECSCGGQFHGSGA